MYSIKNTNETSQKLLSAKTVPATDYVFVFMIYVFLINIYVYVLSKSCIYVEIPAIKRPRIILVQGGA